MPKYILFLFGILLTAPLVRAQEALDSTVTISGLLLDAATDDPIIGARVAVENTQLGDVTNAEGEFRIAEVPKGRQRLLLRSVGFEERVIELWAASDTTLRLTMLQKSVQGKDITVESDREREREQRSVSRVTIDEKTLDRVPSVGGEKDLFRVLQLLPGVKSLSEISSGLYIRGGSPDQNLIRLDGAVIYNPSHMFGFFSTFNTDAIESVELIKGGYPAEYGGRLTSVLNVVSKDGNREQWHGKTSVSLISAKQMFEFPLGDGSMLVSGRRTYIDAFMDLIDAESLLADGTTLPRYYFYDLNAKIVQSLSDNNNLSLSTYFGRDKLSYPTGSREINMHWGNTMASLNWTHIFSEKLLSNALVAYTGYNSEAFGNFTNNGFRFDNGIQEYTARYDVDYKMSDKHSFKSGLGVSRFNFDFYNSIGNTNKPLKDTSGIPWYFTAYAQHDLSFDAKTHLTYGVRSEWMHLSEVVTVDPRITLSYQLSPLWSAKVSAGSYHQYFHLVSFGDFTFFDLWVPGVAPLPPSRSYQYIAGLSGYPMEDYYMSLEAYYKPLNDIVDYNETKFLSNDITEIFPRGSGKAYGTELFFEKRAGALTGWVGYTLAWVRHKFAELNDGVEYSPKYDQRHDVQLVLNYKISDRWEIGGTWVYATGQAFTAPTAYYNVGLSEINFNLDLTVPGHRGGQRLPAYHRGDLSATYSFKMFGYPARASLQVFNFYNHRNVWFRSVDSDTAPPTQTDILLLPILPTLGIEISY